ncbi:hypothetical protein EKO23_12855 [Nocardioides guangzhouensis]|uniref:Peptidase C39-like domain-containing protein n=1 Tax=Nocardioides guangzhouensis TaxID=2497878 RepID=A0A4Q4ZDD1_9ACTN|nr:C39 family peptidase [Nocardioides guangzhouensis]RYP85366.1 hypothetical protein EKO23_12855 [Nocardioides guangzhouensis]
MSHRPFPSVSRLSRRTTIAIGALALMLAAAPFLPRSGPQPAIENATDAGPAGLAGATAGTGAVTPAMRAEIDRVLGAARASGRATQGRTLSPAALVRDQVRCATFEGQRYCLHSGWTRSTQAQVVTELSRTAADAARRTPRESTGDLDPLALLRQRQRMPLEARLRADRAELTDAARSVAKVWLLRNQVQGTPLPTGFLAAHPEVRLRTASGDPAATTQPKKASDYPERGYVLTSKRTTEQTRTYWCGPTTMQMIGWGWRYKRSQKTWANRLGTTRDGSSITNLVGATNRYTGWDQERYAGRYIVLDIKDWSYGRWYLLQMRHYGDYRAPVILHPVLLKKWYPYLDDDASGHFQVGRGWNKNGDKANLLRYFEPWNQQRFDPSEPYIARSQERSAYRSYRANKEHFQHNIGV